MPYIKKCLGGGGTGKQCKTASSARPTEERVWFCSAYNRKTSQFNEPHLTRFNDKSYLVQHICTTCWQKEKKKSGDCPLIDK